MSYVTQASLFSSIGTPRRFLRNTFRRLTEMAELLRLYHHIIIHITWRRFKINVFFKLLQLNNAVNNLKSVEKKITTYLLIEHEFVYYIQILM